MLAGGVVPALYCALFSEAFLTFQKQFLSFAATLTALGI
jgi:hypothetical protein